MLPEPDPVDQAVAVAFHDVHHRIELEIGLQRRRQQFDRPEDGCPPEHELQRHRHQLTHIAQKDDHRRGQPGKTEQQDQRSGKVVWKLYTVNRDGGPVYDEHDENHGQEEKVDHKSRDKFDQRQDADAEGHLLHQEAVLQYRPRGRGKRIAEEKPGDDPRRQPEHVGHIVHRLALEGEGEHEPEDGDVHRRVHEGPQHAEIRAQVLVPEIAPRHLGNDLPARDQLGNERSKYSQIVHMSRNLQWVKPVSAFTHHGLSPDSCFTIHA